MLWALIFNVLPKRLYPDTMRKLVLFLMLASPFFVWAQNETIRIGEIVPEITINDPEGKEIKLSDYRGKLVLIEFWASWDRVSRQNHPEILRCYNRYQNKKFENANGFSCFSVSLDKYKNAWINAISLDALIWNAQGCTFNYWDCVYARLYQVDKLPYYLLIDEDGLLLHKLFHVEKLDEILSSYLLKN
jgi:hypothetical protein